MLFRGIKWKVNRSYSDFMEFHFSLQRESNESEYLISIPDLPKKECRGLDKLFRIAHERRRHNLEQYLRCIVQTYPNREASKVLANFLSIPYKALATSVEVYLYGDCAPESPMRKLKTKLKVPIQMLDPQAPLNSDL